MKAANPIKNTTKKNPSVYNLFAKITFNEAGNIISNPITSRTIPRIVNEFLI
ncbi:MAG: hypothetical protein ACE5RF_03470 [Nitrosarchaeum sp.]